MRSGLLAGIRWSVCMLKSHRSLCKSFSWTGAGLCIYYIFEISCTFPSGPPCRPSRVLPYTPSVLICCIRLLCDGSFRLCHRIAYIYCFVASYLFWLWYDFFFFFFFFFLLLLLLLLLFLVKFFTPASAADLSLEIEWQVPHVSRTLLSILADLKHAVVWVFSTRLLIL